MLPTLPIPIVLRQRALAQQYEAIKTGGFSHDVDVVQARITYALVTASHLGLYYAIVRLDNLSCASESTRFYEIRNFYAAYLAHLGFRVRMTCKDDCPVLDISWSE